MKRSLWLWLALGIGLAVAFALDATVAHALRPFRPILDPLLSNSVRWLGVGYVQIPILLILILVGILSSRRLASAAAWSLLSFAVASGLASVLKVLVHRQRPWTTAPPPEMWAGYLHAHAYQSFPSGESTASFAVAAALSCWYPRWRWLLLTLAGAVAIARLLVGVHFPSDVWAGAMLGIATAHLISGRRAAADEKQRASRESSNP